MPAAIDPPIIISGGGGDSGGGGPMPPPLPTPSKKPAPNVIQVAYEPENQTGPKKFKTKVNKDAEIKSVLIEFPGMAGQNPITMSGYDVYNIKITFNTGPATRSLKPKPAPARKTKKYPAKKKSSPARKKSK